MNRRTWTVVTWVAAVAVLLGLAGGVRWWLTRPKGPQWVTQPVHRGEVVQVVNATGVVQPVVLSPVGSQVSGIVWKIHADFNDPVTKGQVLLELDPATFKAQVAQAEANLANALASVRHAEAALSDARIAATRARALAEKHYIAEADRDTANAKEKQADADVASARAQVELARAQVERSRLDLKNSVILSPVDGVVIARNIELGQAVAAAFQAPNLYTIAQDLRQMQVLANVDEADIGMVKLGQIAQFTVDAFRNRRFTAEVAQVRNAAQTVQNVVTYVVVLNVNNGELLLRPGMTANVRMEVARRENTLLVPNAALRFKPKVEGGPGAHGGAGGGGPRAGKGAEASEGHGGGGHPRKDGAARGTVYVADGAGLKPVPVLVGITDGTQTELVSGLNEGDEVVVEAARSGGAAAPAQGPGNPFAPSPPRMGGGGPRRGF